MDALSRKLVLEQLDRKLEMSLAEEKSIGLIKLKTTVVFTSVSLMGQW